MRTSAPASNSDLIPLPNRSQVNNLGADYMDKF